MTRPPALSRTPPPPRAPRPHRHTAPAVSLLVLLTLAVSMPSVLARDPPPPQSPASDTSSTGESRSSLDMNSLPEADRKRFLDALESSFLTGLGMGRRPSPTGRRAVHVPRRLRELYERLNGLETGTLARQLRRRRRHEGEGRRRRRGDGNTVRGFVLSGQEHMEDGMEHLGFDLSSLPKEEKLIDAELHILVKLDDISLRKSPLQSNAVFQNRYKRGINDSRPVTNVSTTQNQVDIYQVLQPSTAENKDAILKLLDSKSVKAHRTKWHVFDIWSAVEQWKKDPSSNYGLQVCVTAPSGGTYTHHVRLRRSAVQSKQEWVEDQPYVVAYTDDGKDKGKIKKKKGKRTRRSRKSRQKKLKKKNKNRRRNKSMCQRHNLYVDFKDVGWNDWIVAPNGYDAFYCHGDCPFYLPDHLNSTNHAMVQSMVHSVNPQAVPKPCCVPTVLSSLSMLYRNYDDAVVLKTYRDMTVDACGCR